MLGLRPLTEVSRRVVAIVKSLRGTNKWRFCAGSCLEHINNRGFKDVPNNYQLEIGYRENYRTSCFTNPWDLLFCGL